MEPQGELHSHIVSPYLQQVGPELEARLRPRLASLSCAASANVKFVYDLLNLRVVALHIDELAALISSRLRGEPFSTGSSEFEFFKESELLLTVDAAFRRHRYTCVEIEINRHCNYRCAFCPVKDLAKPRGFMRNALFTPIVARVAEYGATQVTLHHYSEPSLDPMLCEKVEIAAQHGLTVRLHTNASLLSEEKILSLKNSGNIGAVIVNLPSVDPDSYAQITQSALFQRAIDNLLMMHRVGLPVHLSINLARGLEKLELERLNDRFSALLGISKTWWTTSRAGVLNAPNYALGRTTEGLLDGCAFAINQINVTYEGKVFLCCMDYHQDYIVGDLIREPLRDIAESATAVSLRRRIFGHTVPEPGFICTSCECSGNRAPNRLSVGTRQAGSAILGRRTPILISSALR